MTTRGTAVTTQISPSLYLTRDQPLIDSWLIGSSTLPPQLCLLFFPNIFTLKQRYWAAAIIALMFLILSTRSKSLELDAIEWGSGISSSFLRVGNKLPEGCHPDINRWLLLSEFMVMRALEQPPHTDTSHQQKLRQKARCRVWRCPSCPTPGCAAGDTGPPLPRCRTFILKQRYTLLLLLKWHQPNLPILSIFSRIFSLFGPDLNMIFPNEQNCWTRGCSALDTETLLLIGIIKLYFLHKIRLLPSPKPESRDTTSRGVTWREARDSSVTLCDAAALTMKYNPHPVTTLKIGRLKSAPTAVCGLPR